MNFQKVPEGRPLRMAVIGAGNRANKYLEYARRHPERLQPVAVVDGNELRRNETAERFGLAAERRYADYDAFFARPADADAVLITTPDDVHFDPCMKAIDAGLHVLLEKPIAQRLDECRAIARRARERGVLVGICHVLRYNAAEVPAKMGTFPQYDHPHTLARYAECARFCGICGKDDEETLDLFIQKIEELKAKVGIKKSIAEYGISEEAFMSTLDQMVEDAFDDQCTGANPRYPLLKEIKAMYLKAYYGEKA